MTDAGSTVEVVVVGAGVAGLAAARALQAAGRDVAVLEAEDVPGGALRTDEVDGYTVERGPNAFQLKPPAAAFLERARLADALVPAGPEARLRALFTGGRLEPVPTSVAAALRTPLLSPRGKLRVLAEPFVPRGDPTSESVAEFVARRLGREALERLAAPFLVGVYAGDETQLGAEAVLPALVGYERARGSIARGALAAARDPRRSRGRTGSWSAPRGLGGLARALAAPLGERLALGSAVTALARDGAGFAVETARGVRLRARGVVLAVPAPAAASLLRALDRDAAELLDSIAYAPLVSAALGVDPGSARAPIRGFGFLVPREAGLDLLGVLYMSRVFPGRAPPGRELLAAMLGGARWPGAVDAPDDVLAARLGAGLERTLGLREAPAPLALTRWRAAVAQPGRDHPRLVARLRERVAALGPLRLAGAYLDGVSIADALASGPRAASELL
ncbi:MAG TPA: protoporphyrinogen oxidase [Myxococcota bacterium]|nr:protoporphyrinogen oxidase [Myxococcota bacterium]